MSSSGVLRTRWFYKINKALRSLFSRTYSTNEPDFFESYIKQYFSEIPSNYKEVDGLPRKEIDTRILSAARSISKLGYDDGIRGIPQENAETISSASILSIKEFINANTRGEIEASSIDHHAKTELAKLAETTFKERQDHFFNVEKIYRENRKKYSLWIGLFYLFISVLLIFGDIPLAYKTVVSSFGFDSISPILSGSELIDSFEENAIELILAVLLVLAIALFAFYMKLYYDDYIVDIVGIQTKNEQNSHYRLIFSSTIFLSLIVVLVLLGVLRHRSFTQSPIPDLVAPITYVLLTIILPLIGGIFFSEGYNYIRRRRVRNNFYKELKSAEKKYEESQLALSEAKKKIERFNGFSSWVNDKNSFLEQYSKYLLGCYKHFYNHGRYDANLQILNSSEFDIANLMQNKFLAKKISQNVFQK